MERNEFTNECSEMIASVHDSKSRQAFSAGRLALDEVKDLTENIFQIKRS